MMVVNKTKTMVVEAVFWALRFFYSKILGLFFSAPPRAVPTMKNSILMESAASLARRIRMKKVTSTEIVESFMYRIKEIHQVLNCVVDERFEEALEEARKVDDIIKFGSKTQEELERDSPLLGVPFTVQESIGVKGLSHSGGLWKRRETTADADSEVVKLMRKAGAIPLACTNVSEGCSGYETYNPLYGRTVNPYNTNRTMGGSSGGEACMVAACGSPLGLGCDSGGSLRVSCAFSGIFGHKPSAAISSLDGVFPHSGSVSDSFSVLGPMSKSAEDLLLVLKIMSRNRKTDLTLDDPVDIKQLKYFFMENDGGGKFTTCVTEDIKGAIEKAVDHFKNVHNATTKRVDLAKMRKGFLMWMSQRKEISGKRLEKMKMMGEDRISACRELIKGFWGKSKHTAIFLLAAMAEDWLEFHSCSDQAQLKRELSELLKELQDLLGSDGVLIYPTQPTEAPIHNESLARVFDWGYSAIFNALGLPATHCPAGLNSQNLPIGFQVVAAANQDRLTLAVAKEVERIFAGWKPPPTYGALTLKKAVLQKSDGKANLL